jgi:hypothetical protein
MPVPGQNDDITVVLFSIQGVRDTKVEGIAN